MGLQHRLLCFQPTPFQNGWQRVGTSEELLFRGRREHCSSEVLGSTAKALVPFPVSSGCIVGKRLLSEFKSLQRPVCKECSGSMELAPTVCQQNPCQGPCAWTMSTADRACMKRPKGPSSSVLLSLAYLYHWTVGSQEEPPPIKIAHGTIPW